MEIFTPEQLQSCVAGHDWFFYLGKSLNLEFFKKYSDIFENTGIIKNTTLYKVSHDGDRNIRLEEKVRILLGEDEGLPALMLAARQGNVAIAEKLIAKGAHPDAGDGDGSTALMLATGHGHTDVVKLLLEKGADVNATNKHGATALRLARQEGYATIVKMLKEAGAKE